MKANQKRRVLAMITCVGLIMIIMIVFAAFAAELKHENNQLTTKNEALQGEVDTLSVKIKSYNNIEHIEKVARTELGMVHPTADQCVYITSKDSCQRNLAAVIREEAYD
ncbi:septum formation initiator family protein [Eubacterium pyruvativorans]|uniref:FtsB family cell division protein n=1 Tax=Eubacterium pyruvativorans TaxID=155865 RepID=UPI0008816473|nr:septum formation initiator family protein [Eubacterium pyruvativorans]SDF43298.1 cell division protein FtsL [Eubacterium pyruvativorans]